MALIAILATSIIVPLTLGKNNKNIPKPYVDNFDQTNDIYITLKWNKVKNADSYTLQYCFGNIFDKEAVIENVKTNGLSHKILRQKGVLTYRVKRNSDGKNIYSDWHYFNVNSLKLDTVNNVTLNNQGILSWQNVRYLDKETQKKVPSYVVDVILSGELLEYPRKFTNYKCTENQLNIMNLICNVIYIEDEEEWSDIIITAKIKSLNYYDSGSIKTIEGYEFLFNAYDESIYYEENLIINKDLYKMITG